MNNIQIIVNEFTGIEWVQIENAPNEFTSMPKSVYDEQQKALKDAAK